MADAPAVPAAPPTAPAAPPPSAPPAAPPAAPAAPPPSDPPATPPAASGTWRDDWRGAAAKGDEKLVKRLERYADPETAFAALFSAQDSIAKNGLRMPAPGADATPEQIAEYRKANGVPESHDKYDLTLPNGLVVGEADKPLVDSFTKFGHGKNWSNDQVKQGLEWYYSNVDAQRQQREEADATYKEQGLAKLGEMYKGDFKRNIRMVNEYLDGAPESVKTNILGARLPNGRLLGADPEMIDWLFQQAHFRNPQATVMGGNSEANVKAAETELAELRGMMGDKNSAYWKGADAQKKQARFRELTDAVNKVKSQRG